MTVALVGAGPGDPGLLTLRGLARLRPCECSSTTGSSPTRSLRGRRRRVARRPRRPPQHDIIARLVVSGRRGRRVVPLKGGDPFVFGRGGEEAIALVRAGVPFELVPGVSSIAAVPEAAGIPVTHRGVSQSVTAFTANDVESLDVWALAQVPGTLVAFMGGARRRPAGRAADRGRASRRRRRPRSSRAGRARIRRSSRRRSERSEPPLSKPPTPALVVIGEVVAVREALALRSAAA